VMVTGKVLVRAEAQAQAEDSHPQTVERAWQT
jgi:hypothetical protein